MEIDGNISNAVSKDPNKLDDSVSPSLLGSHFISNYMLSNHFYFRPPYLCTAYNLKLSHTRMVLFPCSKFHGVDDARDAAWGQGPSKGKEELDPEPNKVTIILVVVGDVRVRGGTARRHNLYNTKIHFIFKFYGCINLQT